MAFKQVQCPNCFTEYAIPEEQLKVADGIIRCGTCRGQYRAIVLSDDLSPSQFDPRDVFVEPMSNPLEEDAVPDIDIAEEFEPSYVNYQERAESPNSDIELKSSHEFEYQKSLEPEVPSQVIDAYGDSDELSTSEILKNLRKKPIDSENQIDFDILDHKVLDREVTAPHEEDEPTSTLTAPTITTPITTKSEAKSDDDLIDEVDQLVDKKFAKPSGKRKSTKDKHKLSKNSQMKEALKSHHDIDDFLLEPRKLRQKKGNAFSRTVGFIFKLIAILLLLAVLAYQLWIKQVYDIPDQVRDFEHPMLDLLAESSEPYLLSAEEVIDDYGITLPKRKSLGMLELVSALTEPHPNRDNTTLLKVSLINRAAISQPLPWLEMSLMDSQGNLIARRNLSPEDYIYNNRTDASIGSKELKKITVELLSFPKNASGYEIKIIDR